MLVPVYPSCPGKWPLNKCCHLRAVPNYNCCHTMAVAQSSMQD